MAVKIKITSSGPDAWFNPEKAARAVAKAFAGETKVLAAQAADLVRSRVQNEGTGADGSAVAGYSTTPIHVEQYSGLKPKRRPRGGKRKKVDKGYAGDGKNGNGYRSGFDGIRDRNNWQAYYHGGYKEYREKTGMQTGGFYFSNFGTAWRHWGELSKSLVKPSGGTGFYWSTDIGFRRREDQLAANEAETKRPRLFHMGSREQAYFGKSYVEPAFNRAFAYFLS